MKKKLKKGRVKETENTETQTKVRGTPKSLNKLKIYLGILIAALAFVLYAQSISHEYTLDDHNVIDKNFLTKTGIDGIPTILKTDYWYGSRKDELRGPIYRPTSLVVFAIVWELSPDNPHAYHFINVLLYAFTCLLLFLIVCRLFKTQNLLLPFICALLFTAHPIHTEVVNNIKSLDEILCFLFGLISIWFLLKYASTKSRSAFLAGGVSFFLSLISKETGISFLLIIPLIIFFYSDHFRKSIIPILILLFSLTGLWLILRMNIFEDLDRSIVTQTSELNNTLYAAPNLISRYATAFYILLRYIGLLIIPHPLSCDYNYAQIKIQSPGDLGAVAGIILYLAIGIYLILNFRKKSIPVFGILFFLLPLAPVSNIFFLGGSSMAERFLYIPSLGFCIVLAYLLIRLTKAETVESKFRNLSGFLNHNQRVFLVVLGICSLYFYKTTSRNKDWKDTLTVFTQDIQVSKNSATANHLLGNSLLLSVAASSNTKNRSDTFNLAKIYLKKALEIAPGFFNASSNLGYIYLVENKADSAYFYLKEGLKYGPNDVPLNYYLGSALYLLKRYDESVKVLTYTVSLNPNYEDAYMMLASAYLAKEDTNNGLQCYLKIIGINPNNPKAYHSAASILKARGDAAKANEYFNKAASLGYRPN
jgi:protein O-mannosyl-transferase